MKLYTEEQVKKAIAYARSVNTTTYENPTIERVLRSLTPIELPSDKEIEKQSYKWVFASRVWEQGAKWMKEQILNQNK